MKKFITTIPLQTQHELNKSVYEAIDNERLVYNEKISFPIISVMNGYVGSGEEIELLVIKQKDERTEHNYQIFQSQIEDFKKKKGCVYTINLVEIEYSEVIATHLHTFKELIKRIQKGDELYACATYGSKPVPIVEMMVMNYAYRVIEQVTIGCIVYGQYNHQEGYARIYDITSLFHMDEIVRNVANMKLDNPLKFIENVLQLDDSEEV